METEGYEAIELGSPRVCESPLPDTKENTFGSDVPDVQHMFGAFQLWWKLNVAATTTSKWRVLVQRQNMLWWKLNVAATTTFPHQSGEFLFNSKTTFIADPKVYQLPTCSKFSICVKNRYQLFAGTILKRYTFARTLLVISHNNSPVFSLPLLKMKFEVEKFLYFIKIKVLFEQAIAFIDVIDLMVLG